VRSSVRGLAPLALAALLVAGLASSWRQYEAGRELGTGERLTIAAASRTAAAERSAILLEAEDRLETARSALPGDPRPSYLLGSGAMLLGEPAEALLRYRASLAVEERPETDLNLSRAQRAAGDPAAAAADALRAVWLAPALIEELPAQMRGAVGQVLARLERQLEAGSAAAIPPLAPSDAAAAQHDR
jgi:hypothetical protein